jgi:predicted secreted hydrolase
MKTRITLYFIFFLISFNLSAQDWKVYPYAPVTTPSSEISFPLDEGRHSDPVEWWYVSGHITTASSKNYSFMLTYFYYPYTMTTFPFLSFDGFRILNLTDESDGTFYQDTKAVTSYTTLSNTGLDIEASLLLGGSEYWRNKVDGTSNILPFEYELNASSGTVSISFDLETLKRPLIVGGDGLFDQGLSNYTYYYSQTDNSVSGSLTLNGATETVTGSAWIDRQYGDFNPFLGEDYEWFSLKLDNDMDLNLWNIFTADRTIPNDPKYKILSAYVDINQNTQYTISDFEIERLEYFTTPDNQKRYSKKWRLTSASKNIDLIITANHTTSEVDISELSFRFFEGAITITGTIDGETVTGIGFAELLHSYEIPDISIVSPNGGVYNTTNPIAWVVNNPDDGRPLLFDLEYSTDNSIFTPIATGLTTNNYTWDGTGINNGDAVWFKVKSYSVDNSLTSEVVSSSSFLASLSSLDLNSKNIRVYPNPVKNEITLEFQMPLVNSTFLIMDINGRLISTKNADNTLIQKIDTQFISKGIYFLHIKSDDFKQVIKFVKK